ncbi:hypothetical protein HJG60_021012 [Phyllostomus discolor]|uniref:Uncharacterized protein n=1 Tax=Phyllostomus discolor TaxID=89673 RepID=A0A834EFI6_9CHIR|nr:hypothetical protein HJG60_021012 [Phyllostomus discolor]
MEEVWKYEMFPKWEIGLEEKEEEERLPSEKPEDAKSWDYLVPQRELKHIKKHVQRTQRARDLRTDLYQTPPGKVPREAPSPRTCPWQKKEHPDNVQRAPKVKTPKQRVAWAQEQMKRHHDRMARGRELAERSKDQSAQSLAAPPPPVPKPKPRVRAEEVREFEWVTAYPLAQPHEDAPIEVTILREKPKEEGKTKSPLPRGLLNIPPFLKSQLENNKVIS